MKTWILHSTPPKSEIKSGGVKFYPIEYGDLDEDQPITMTGYELHQAIGRHNTGRKLVTILETPGSDVSQEQILALYDLVSGNWRFRLKRARFTLNVSAALSGTHESYPSFTKHQITPVLVQRFGQGFAMLSEKKRFFIGLTRWATAIQRLDPLDTVLDLCSCLESIFNFSSELRLKLSLASYHIASSNKKSTFSAVYEMYGKRCSFIHGSKIPDVTDSQIDAYTGVVTSLLRAIVVSNRFPEQTTINKLILSRYSGERPSNKCP